MCLLGDIRYLPFLSFFSSNGRDILPEPERTQTIKFGTVKPVLSGHSKIDKTKILLTNGSLTTVESICRMLQGDHSAILLTYIKLNSVLKTNFGLLFEWPLKTQVLLYHTFSNTTN